MTPYVLFGCYTAGMVIWAHGRDHGWMFNLRVPIARQPMPMRVEPALLEAFINYRRNLQFEQQECRL